MSEEFDNEANMRESRLIIGVGFWSAVAGVIGVSASWGGWPFFWASVIVGGVAGVVIGCRYMAAVVKIEATLRRPKSLSEQMAEAFQKDAAAEMERRRAAAKQ